MGKKPRVLSEEEVLRAGIGGASELEENPRPRGAPGKPRSGMEFTDSRVRYSELRTDAAGMPILPKRERPEPAVDMSDLEEIEAEPATANELEDLRTFESKHGAAIRPARTTPAAPEPTTRAHAAPEPAPVSWNETILVNGLKVHRDVGIAHLKTWFKANVRNEGNQAKKAIALLEATYEQVYAEPFPAWASKYLHGLI